MHIMGASQSVPNADIEKKVDTIILSHKVVIFSKRTCPYCYEVKKIFKEFGEFHTVELDQTEDGNAMFDYLHEKTGARTVPRVFVNGQFIGGCSETKMQLNSGHLQSLLTK